ncbi:recombinase family protein [Pedobacter sp. N36a]|uniref:recombinase family protein n=1 Tax=Pedobacter sp. N36a TaxID=2767996 RepID=UPI001656D9E8|nr:recombinase family protein [Pedobacter sp. N36a]MBC8988409.1 recombinase family protein [Pedobacter sp. N36a]
MKIKYNRVSTLQQTGIRFTADKDIYDKILLDKVSGSIPFKDRPQAKELVKLIDKGVVKELIVEEFSRLGRNTGDVINTVEWLDEKGVNVIVRNLGLQSRPDGNKNPVWKMISTIMSSLYEMELENIKERTTVGRMLFVQNGGQLGRPKGSKENDLEFLKKVSSISAINCLKKNFTVRETSKVAGISVATVMKIKKLI